MNSYFYGSHIHLPSRWTDDVWNWSDWLIIVNKSHCWSTLSLPRRNESQRKNKKMSKSETRRWQFLLLGIHGVSVPSPSLLAFPDTFRRRPIEHSEPGHLKRSASPCLEPSENLDWLASTSVLWHEQSRSSIFDILCPCNRSGQRAKIKKRQTFSVIQVTCRSCLRFASLSDIFFFLLFVPSTNEDVRLLHLHLFLLTWRLLSIPFSSTATELFSITPRCD